MATFRTTFNKFSSGVARSAGSPMAFSIALASIVIWGVAGPYYKYSEGWQIVINTSTTIITFLMVFIIQNSQNRESLSLQIKLDELIRAVDGARNHFIALDELDETQLVDTREELKSAEAELAKRSKAKNKPNVAKTTKLIRPQAPKG